MKDEVRTYNPGSDTDPARVRAEPLPTPTAKDIATIVSRAVRSVPAAVVRRLPETSPTGAIPPYRAAGKDSTNPRGTGGIASPLSEGTAAAPDTTARTYYEPEIITSSDGILSFEIMQIQSIKMVDASGAEVQFNFVKEGS